MSKKSKTPPNNIAQNKKARHEYILEDKFEAGIALEGWEVKALRAGQVSLIESYIMLKDGEAFLFGCSIQALKTASTHITPELRRNRKLLLHSKELAKIISGVNKDNYTCVPVSMYWSKKNFVKLQIALAKGKQDHDKRASIKERDWNRDKQRVLRKGSL